MGRRLGSFIGVATLVLISAVAIVPVAWTLLGAFKKLRDIVTPTPKLFFEPTLSNFAYVFSNDTIRSGLANSAVIVGLAVAIGAALGIPAAYTMSRHVGRRRDDLTFFVLSLRFLPPVAIAVPFIALFLDIGLYDTYAGMVLVYLMLTVSTIIWLAVPAFDRVPVAIEEAASLEGSGPGEIFWRIALPVAAPSLFGAVVFTFVVAWNELLIALSLTSERATLPVAAASITSMGKEVPWGVINASTILLSLPPLLFIVVLMQFLNRTLKA